MRCALHLKLAKKKLTGGALELPGGFLPGHGLRTWLEASSDFIESASSAQPAFPKAFQTADHLRCRPEEFS